MTRRTVFFRMLAVALAGVMTAGVIFTSCEKKKIDIDISKVDTSDRDEKGYSKNMHDALLQKYGEPKADIFTEGQGIIGWWDNWQRTSEGNATNVKSINADCSQLGGGLDEGRGFYWRALNDKSSRASAKGLHLAGFKTGAWIEGQGDSAIFIMSVHKNEDGTYERDENGTTVMKGFAWTWAATNPRVKPDGNEIVWAGVHSFVNNEEWAYPYVISEYPDFPMPTYPDGTPATGYLEGGDVSNAHLARIYDACAAKDINGCNIRFQELGKISGEDRDLLKLVDKDGLHDRFFLRQGRFSSFLDRLQQRHHRLFRLDRQRLLLGRQLERLGQYKQHAAHQGIRRLERIQIQRLPQGAPRAECKKHRRLQHLPISERQGKRVGSCVRSVRF